MEQSMSETLRYLTSRDADFNVFGLWVPKGRDDSPIKFLHGILI